MAILPDTSTDTNQSATLRNPKRGDLESLQPSANTNAEKIQTQTQKQISQQPSATLREESLQPSADTDTDTNTDKYKYR